METEQYLLYGIIFFVISACATLVTTKKIRIVAYFISLFGSLSFLFLGFYLFAAIPVMFHARSVTSIFEFALRGDALSGFFVILISLMTFATSLYSIGFTCDLAHSNLVCFFYNILILSLYSVALSANIITFLVSWDTMAVASYLLVTMERTDKASRSGLFTL